jgi:small GTP-binding protein
MIEFPLLRVKLGIDPAYSLPCLQPSEIDGCIKALPGEPFLRRGVVGSHYNEFSLYSFLDSGKPPMTEVPVSRIRNFSIIAHIDHGKSTLADRLLHAYGHRQRSRHESPVSRQYGSGAGAGNYHQAPGRPHELPGKGWQDYILNLIDTPGHVDFSYEVSRSLVACEGHCWWSMPPRGLKPKPWPTSTWPWRHDLEIIPVLNKIDLPGADPERIKQEIEDIIGLDCSNAILASAKEGIGIDEILESIIYLVPPPQIISRSPCGR